MEKESQKRKYRPTGIKLKRNDPKYDETYHREVRVPQKMEEAKQRAEKLSAKKAMRQARKVESNEFRKGFEECIEARTDREKQRKLCAHDGFIRWTEKIVEKDDRHGLPILGSRGKDDRSTDEDPEYYLELNKKYGTGEPPLFVRRATVKKSKVYNGGYCLCSNVRHEAGSIIGVYMGKKPPSKRVSDRKSHKERPYLLSGIADAEGGIGSGKPALLGMHFINDPNFNGVEEGCKPKPVNVVVYSDGLMVARCRINVGQEFSFSYWADLGER